MTDDAGELTRPLMMEVSVDARVTGKPRRVNKRLLR